LACQLTSLLTEVSSSVLKFGESSWRVLESATTSRLPTTLRLMVHMVERSHRQIKDALRARLASADWLSHLPWVLLSLRATLKDDSNISSAEMVYGLPLSLPGELRIQLPLPSPLFQDGQQAATENISLPAFLPTRNQPPPSSATSLPKALQEATFVYVRCGGVSLPLTPVYSGPYAVIQKNPKSFTVDLGGRHDVISVDHLKPHVGSAPVVPASAPRRGRPSSSVL